MAMIKKCYCFFRAGFTTWLMIPNPISCFSKGPCLSTVKMPPSPPQIKLQPIRKEKILRRKICQIKATFFFLSKCSFYNKIHCSKKPPIGFTCFQFNKIDSHFRKFDFSDLFFYANSFKLRNCWLKGIHLCSLLNLNSILFEISIIM